MNDQVKVFLSYSHKDKDLKEAFVTHLYSLIRTENINFWTDDQIEGGQEWNAEIENKLQTSDLILLLISPSFIQSEYCYNKELKQAIELHEQHKAVVFPVGLVTTDITGMPFEKLQITPPPPKFIDTWPNANEAFTTVIQEIRKTLTSLVVEMKNWNPKARKENIRKLIGSAKFEDACNELFDFVYDFSNNEDLKDDVCMIKGSCLEILSDKGKIDYEAYRKSIKQLVDDIFNVFDKVLLELNTGITKLAANG